METSFGNDLIESLKHAVEHAKGQSTAGKVHIVEAPDVRSLRKRLKMTQQAFSSAYRIPLATLSPKRRNCNDPALYFGRG